MSAASSMTEMIRESRSSPLDIVSPAIHRGCDVVPSPELPVFSGQQVALVGRLSVLSRRDVRAIVERLGGTFSSDVTPRTVTVVAGAEAAVDVPAHVVRVLSESDLCREAGLPDLEILRARYYSARDLRGMYPAIDDEHLRCLEKWGLVRPVVGRYSFNDLHVVRQAAAELEGGATLPGLLRALSATAQGQLAFDFQPRAERAPARVVSLPARSAAAAPPPASDDRSHAIAAANRALATKYFLEGAELDDGPARDLDGAAAAYRRAALFDPQLVPAIVNLANVHYERDELVEAEALYEKAIRLDAECFEAWFNLGNIHHDLSRFSDAIQAYREALTINPGYPEAHFYLAVTLEKVGRSAEARQHWREYRTLAPDGEFVELANEFSD
jgi:tetratricopeptide (TPR) repeat protein